MGNNLADVLSKASKGTTIFKVVGKDIYFSKLAQITDRVSAEEYEKIKRDFFKPMILKGKSIVVDMEVAFVYIRRFMVAGTNTENETALRSLA